MLKTNSKRWERGAAGWKGDNWPNGGAGKKKGKSFWEGFFLNKGREGEGEKKLRALKSLGVREGNRTSKKKKNRGGKAKENHSSKKQSVGKVSGKDTFRQRI